ADAERRAGLQQCWQIFRVLRYFDLHEQAIRAMSSTYRRPPITEAVVELRLATPIEFDQIEKIKDRLTDQYPVTPQQMQQISINAGPGNQNTANVEVVGYRCRRQTRPILLSGRRSARKRCWQDQDL